MKTTNSVLVGCLLTTSVLFATGAQPAQEQQQPSLEETVKWLTEKLPVSAGWSEGEMSRKMDLVEFQGCTLTYRLSQRATIGGIANVVIPLADIDPDAVKVTHTPDDSVSMKTQAHYQCLLKTKASRNLIKLSFSIVASGRTHLFSDSPVSETMIPFSDEATAQRFVKALAHAATLCSKRKEPF